MKDIVFLSADSSDVLGFSIKQNVLESLQLKWKDLIEIEFFKEYKGMASFVLLRKIRKFGSSFGVSIPKKLVKELNFKKDESLQVYFRIPA